MKTKLTREQFGGGGIEAMQLGTQMLNRCASRFVQVLEKNHFTSMRIASHSAAMDHRRADITSSWFILIAAVLALATLAPVAVLASRLI
jgi:hypothetical protein